MSKGIDIGTMNLVVAKQQDSSIKTSRPELCRYLGGSCTRNGKYVWKECATTSK